MNLHGSMAKPMTKSSVIGLCRLVELVKTVREMYLRHCTVIARSVGHITQRFSFQALTIIASVKVRRLYILFWLVFTCNTNQIVAVLKTKSVHKHNSILLIFKIMKQRHRVKINKLIITLLKKLINIFLEGTSLCLQSTHRTYHLRSLFTWHSKLILLYLVFISLIVFTYSHQIMYQYFTLII